MRFILLLIAFCLSSSLAIAADRFVQRLTSPAGHEFFFMEMPETEMVAFDVWWPSNWAYEADRNPAVPYLGVDLLPAGGAGDYDAAELGELFADLGAEGALFVTADGVRGKVLVRSSKVDEAMALNNMVLTAPRLDDIWLERIRDGFKANLEQARKQSSNLAGDAVRNAILGDDPVDTFLTLEDLTVVDKVSRDDIRQWWKETFVTDGITIAVAGGISAGEAAAAIDKVLAGLPKGKTPPHKAIAVDFSPRTIVLHRPEAKKTVLGFLGRLPSTSEGGETEGLLAMQVLGGGEQSRLFEAIRTDLRATYGFQAMPANYTRDVRFFVMTGEVESGHLAEVREVVRDTYEDFREKGPSETEVEALKEAIGPEISKNLDHPNVVAHSMVESELDGTGADRVLKLLDELSAATAAAIHERLRTIYPAADDLVEIIVTPDALTIEGACVIKSIVEARQC